MDRRRFLFGAFAGGPALPDPARGPSVVSRIYNQRRPWDDARKSFVLPPNAFNIVMFANYWYMKDKAASGSPTAYDYEVLAGADGNVLVKPKLDPFPNTYHAYFCYDLPGVCPQ